MHSMYFTRVVIICTYTSGYNTQYTIQTNPTDIYVIMHSCLRMFTGEHVKPVCALREDSCITNTPYIQYIDFLLSPGCALNSLSCWRLIFLRFPPDPSNSVLEKYVPRKIAKNFKKWDHRTQKKTLFSSPGCGADRQTSVSASAHREEKIESDCWWIK